MTKLQLSDPIRVTIKKFDPSRDPAPYYQTYVVPYKREMRILEVLDCIVEELGESLAYQWYCGVKKCGMCGMMVNGKPTLGCWEAVEAEMTIEPMANFPVIRDLVVDRSKYIHDMLAIKPVLERATPYEGFPEPITGTQMALTAEAMHCIECLLCNSVCPTYGAEFVGPAPLVQLARFALNPRDGGERGELSVNIGGIDNCVSCYQCSEACPVGIRVLEVCIDGLRKQIAEQNIGDIAHHNKVYKELVLEQGIVNPSTLMVRSMGWKVFKEIPLTVRMLFRGRISPWKFIKGILKLDRQKKQHEVQQLAQAVDEIDWEAGQ